MERFVFLVLVSAAVLSAQFTPPPSGGSGLPASCTGNALTGISCTNLTVAPIAAPAASLTATVTATAGTPNGTYYYRVTYTTARGETQWGPASAAVMTGGAFQISLTGIPVSANAAVTGRKVYRGASVASMYPVATIANNTATAATDNAANGTGLLARDNTTGAIYIGTDRAITISGQQSAGQGENVVIGIGAWGGNGGGGNNNFGTVVGTNAGASTPASTNEPTFFGNRAGQTMTGQQNVVIGQCAGCGFTAGDFNTFVGTDAGQTGGGGNWNTYIGDGSRHSVALS